MNTNDTNNPTRREFLATTGALAMSAAFVPSAAASVFGLGNITKADTKLKLLILGGTGFLGPQIINHARARGHDIAMFNRGQTDPDLFPGVEHLVGDRYTDLSALEQLVKDGRHFDAVIDTFTYVPKTVTDAMDILKPIMDQFIVISTTNVYADRSYVGMKEDGPKSECSDEIAAGIHTHREVGIHYGPMKYRVERAAEANFPGKVTNLRPGLIVGPRDTTGRYSYWPIRASEGGTMIAPGSGDDYLQYIDVRDLGEFVITCAEKKNMGDYTCLSPMGERTAKDMVDSAVRVAKKRTGTSATPEWIDTEFLGEQGVQPWQHMPVWVPNSAPGYIGHGRMDTSKAIAAGLKTRDIDDTALGALEYYIERGPEIEKEHGEEARTQWAQRVRGGLPAEREKEVLAAWEEHKADD
jgi:2'-hydroxyisoflavone reductase